MLDLILRLDQTLQINDNTVKYPEWFRYTTEKTIPNPGPLAQE